MGGRESVVNNTVREMRLLRRGGKGNRIYSLRHPAAASCGRMTAPSRKEPRGEICLLRRGGEGENLLLPACRLGKPRTTVHLPEEEVKIRFAARQSRGAPAFIVIFWEMCNGDLHFSKSYGIVKAGVN